MLDPGAKEHLLAALRTNRCMLFLGAGCSSGALNRTGQPLPGGSDLARLVWAWAEFEGEYDGSHLSVTFPSAIATGKPLDGLRHLLDTHLLATSVPAWYDAFGRIFWRRIFTTNVDNVIEIVYSRMPDSPALELIVAPDDDFRERDQFLRSIQYVKLHGSLPSDPRHLTFGVIETGTRANAREDWWHHFVRDYMLFPTVFIGSELDEPLFWQALAARGVRGNNPELRPRSYLVIPSISPAKRPLLEAYNITHVSAKAEQFLAWLVAQGTLPSRADVLATVSPDSMEVLAHSTSDRGTQELIEGFLSTFQRVPTNISTGSASARAFLRGAPPTWTDIAIHADAPLQLVRDTQALVEEAFQRAGEHSLIVLLGEGGAGKSTALMRTGVNVALAGHLVFYSDGATRPDIAVIFNGLRALNRKVCLLIDNAALVGPLFPDLVAALKALPYPPVILAAARYIPFEQRLRELLVNLSYSEVQIGPLTDGDIDALIAALDRHNQLGHLVSLTPDERRYEFKQRARKQLLVALREATEGRGFDEILQNEFAELTEREPRILFLCGALATAQLVDLTRGQLLSCAEVSPAAALRMLARDLRGMLTEIDGRDTVAVRHPVIAEYILTRVAGKEEVMEAYRRVLLALSRDIYPGAGRKSRSWRLFVRLINHDAVYDLFGEDIDYARGVYELTASAFASDGHFWLQYANLEVDHGVPAFGRPLLANAEGLLGQTDLVMNTRAHLMLREALTVGSYNEASRLRTDAVELLRFQMEKAKQDDEYPYHVYLTHMLSWIRRWAPDREARKQDLEELLALADSVCKRMPGNTRLKGVRDAVFKEYLGLALTDK